MGIIMEAKDTVMNKEQRDKIGYSGYRSPKELCETQAEISFKAGIKEVVDWLLNAEGIANYYYDGHEGKIQHFIIDESQWQAKLKAWGINP